MSVGERTECHASMITIFKTDATSKHVMLISHNLDKLSPIFLCHIKKRLKTKNQILLSARRREGVSMWKALLVSALVGSVLAQDSIWSPEQKIWSQKRDTRVGV
ncbi:hypothetical protein BaRGS_00003652 [Batillaria attramentaria]|uniref:Uncharacterized protein n=1 Tax=Batillaria attramentaria TaxID=370345 RepID=A0ABD0LZW3_9CAEN